MSDCDDEKKTVLMVVLYLKQVYEDTCRWIKEDYIDGYIYEHWNLVLCDGERVRIKYKDVDYVLLRRPEEDKHIGWVVNADDEY